MSNASILGLLSAVKNHEFDQLVREILECNENSARYRIQITKLSQFREEYSATEHGFTRVSDLNDFRVFLARLEQNINTLNELLKRSDARVKELTNYLAVVDGENKLISNKLKNDLLCQLRLKNARENEQCDEQSITTQLHNRRNYTIN